MFTERLSYSLFPIHINLFYTDWVDADDEPEATKKIRKTESRAVPSTPFRYVLVSHVTSSIVLT